MVLVVHAPPTAALRMALLLPRTTTGARLGDYSTRLTYLHAMLMQKRNVDNEVPLALPLTLALPITLPVPFTRTFLLPAISLLKQPLEIFVNVLCSQRIRQFS